MTDPDNDPVQYYFRVTTGADAESGSVVAESSWLPAGQTSWTVPPGTLRDGVTYHWHVWTFDGYMTTPPASWANSLKVNLRLGSSGPSPFDTEGPVQVNLATGNLHIGLSTPSTPTVGGSIGLSLDYNSQAPSAQGLTGRYFNDPTDAWPAPGGSELSRVDPQVNMAWGTGSPAPQINADHFFATWDGYLILPWTGSWLFGANHDDGTKIWVNNTLVYSNTGLGSYDYGTGGPSGGITLTGGQQYLIHVEYQEIAGNANVTVAASYGANQSGNSGQAWSGNIPSGWLSTTASPLPQGWSLSSGDSISYSRVVMSDRSIILVEPDGTTHEYKRTTAPGLTGYSPPAGEDDIVAVNGAGQVTVHSTDGTNYTFNTDGTLASAVSGTDDRKPAAPRYSWTGNPAQLTQITDPVSALSASLAYGANPQPVACASTNAPAGMLCAFTLWDNTATTFTYNSNGQLASVTNPGGAVTQLWYDGNGRLAKLRDPLQADAVAAAAVTGQPDDDTTKTLVNYDNTTGKTTQVQLAAPAPGGTRPDHSYSYVSGTRSQVSSASKPAQAPFLRQVDFDGSGRLTADTNAANLTATTTWDVPDRTLATVAPGGRETTTLYDGQGRVTDGYGPAPSSCFGADYRPLGSACTGLVNGVAHTHSAYDENINGLAATYWPSQDLTGPPAIHTTGVGTPDGSLNFDWAYTGRAGMVDANNNPIVDHWSARFFGEIVFPTVGQYQLYAFVDDGVRIYIDDNLVIDDWVDQRGNTQPGWFTTSAANETHRLRIDYYENTASATLGLYWVPPGGSAVIVPGAQLHPRYGLETTKTVDDAPTANAPAQDTQTNYANPENGLPGTVTQVPGTGHLNLATTTSYESPGAGYLRPTSLTRPAGTSDTYSYYGPNDTPTNPCTTSAAPSQMGRRSTATSAAPATETQQIDTPSTTPRAAPSPAGPTATSPPAPATTTEAGPPSPPSPPTRRRPPGPSPPTTPSAATR